jgi:gluconolactonase
MEADLPFPCLRDSNVQTRRRSNGNSLAANKIMKQRQHAPGFIPTLPMHSSLTHRHDYRSGTKFPALALALAAVLLGVTAPAAMSQTPTNSPVIADGAQVEKVGSGYGFTEGCTADKDGNVFFTDQNHDPGGQILRWSAEDHKITVWLEPTGRANGERFAPNGDLITCSDEHSQLWRITPDKKVTVLVKDYQGKLLNGPNDVWVVPNGGMYITDPYFHRPWWGPEHATPQQDKNAVYYLTPDGKSLTRVINDFVLPNGIGGAPDGKVLYAADMGGRKLWKYDVQPDGSLTNKTYLCDAGSDGMTMDNQGNIYCTTGGIRIFDKTGKQIEHIPSPGGQQPANIAIGGKEHNILFIADHTSVYTLQLKVKNWDQK